MGRFAGKPENTPHIGKRGSFSSGLIREFGSRMAPAIRIERGIAPPTVLLAEDEVVVRMLLAEEMRATGWNVVEAATADEAWAYLRAGGAAELLFTDMTMPGSMDGLGLMRLVRGAYPAIKIILTSGNLGPRSVNGFDRFIPKPYSLTGAVAAAARLLGLEPDAI
jgi:CheY-like chemotaxis protein